MRELRPALLGIAALCCGLALASAIVALRPGAPGPLFVRVSVLAVGVAFVGCGLLAWWRRPGNRMGPLMTAAGVGWLLAGFARASEPALFTAGVLSVAATQAVIVHLFVAFPRGRLDGAVRRGIVVATYVSGIGGALLSLMSAQVSGDKSYLSRLLLSCESCPRNVLEVAGGGPLDEIGSALRFVGLGACTVAAAVALVLTWRGMRPADRRITAPAVLIGVPGLLLLFVAGVGIAIGGFSDGVVFDLGEVAIVLLALLPFTFAYVILRGGFAATRSFTHLIERLGAEPVRGEELRAAVADALGDPTVQVGYRLPDRGLLVDADGIPIDPGPQGTSQRAVTEVRRRGEQIGALVHERWVLADRGLAKSVAASAALAIDNGRLTADLRATMVTLERTLGELRESRRRIVTASDTERRRIAADLHDGAQQQLLAAAMRARALGAAAQDAERVRVAAAELGDLLDDAAGDLRRLVHGIVPPVLVHNGLEAAVAELARRVPLPITLDATPAAQERSAPDIEQAAYFVVAEALANVIKHADATRVQVRLDRDEHHVRVEVRDDGVGGVAPGAGSGLTGIADRVAALGGEVAVDSPRGAGTAIVATLPSG